MPKTKILLIIDNLLISLVIEQTWEIFELIKSLICSLNSDYCKVQD